MRQISVSTGVFALIWAERLEGEESEDEILLRILQGRRGLEEEPAVVPGSAVTLSESIREQSGEPEMAGEIVVGLRSVRHAYWWQVVEKALENLGKPSPLSAIYREVKSLCAAADRRMPHELEATVRGTLEDNSSDSDRYKRVRDIFCLPEGKHSGVWALRRWLS